MKLASKRIMLLKIVFLKYTVLFSYRGNPKGFDASFINSILTFSLMRWLGMVLHLALLQICDNEIKWYKMKMKQTKGVIHLALDLYLF
jgi:hypothetical protein